MQLDAVPISLAPTPQLTDEDSKSEDSSSIPSSSNSSLPPTPIGEPVELDMPKQPHQPAQPYLTARSDDLFHQWRPTSHLLAPQGWMNDPCGPSFDPRTRLYHMWYQWNPKGSTWGNMSWGHAYSSDMVHWKSSSAPTIEPGKNHDHEGVFTGCVLHRSPLGTEEEASESGEMTAIYTAVSKLPIHHTLPYNYGSEKVVLATSVDGGQSWTSHGVILPGPPETEEVISWRDPYIAKWPLLDAILGTRQPSLYALIAGGIKDKTPTCFAYRIDATDLSCWTYIGTLCDVGRNCRSAPYDVDLGKNWEVANFFTTKNEADVGEQDEYLLINVEGCVEPGPARGSIYMRLDVPKTRLEQGEMRLQAANVGRLDHGCLYAASSFQDEGRDRRIMWGWVTEDDLPEDYYDTQGWSGLLSLPRELFHHPRCRDLGIRPAAEVASLRIGSRHGTLRCSDLLHAAAGSGAVATVEGQELSAVRIEEVTRRSVELTAVLDSWLRGVVLAHSADLSTRTLVYVAKDEVVIDRSQSAGARSVRAKKLAVNTSTLRAAIPAQSGGEDGRHTLRLFLDNSVLEVFVDDLIVLSTRIYPDDADTGLSMLVAPPSGADRASGALEADNRTVDIWHGLSQAHLGFIA